jgi:molybdenum cofactor cytidylyltransferase
MKGIGAVILAAGQGKRFGKLKQFANLGGKPLFLYPVELTCRLKFHSIILVGNKNTAEMVDHIDRKRISYITNKESEQGMSSSLREGILALSDDIRAVLVFLGDQPFIPDGAVEEIISTYEKQYKNGIRIVRPSYQGLAGHPVLFDRCFFSKLTAITGDKGAKEIFESFAGQVAVAEFSRHEWNMDIDTLSDYQLATKYLKNFNP